MPDARQCPTGQILRDPGLNEQLCRSGYVVVDLFDPDEIPLVGQLQEIADRVYVDERSGFHASNLSAHHEYRHAVNHEVSPLVESVAAPLFCDHEAFFSSLVLKWPGDDSSFPSHQDWNMVDEQRFRSINVFVPLVETTVANGALRVLPGSHRVLEPLRGSPNPPTGCESPGWQVTAEQMEVVELRLGQVLLFDHAMLHCSAPNLTDQPRPAMITAFKPVDAELLHWHVPDTERLEVDVYRVDPDFYARFDIGDVPDGTRIRSEPFVPQAMTPQELMSRSAAAAASVSTNAPCPRVSVMCDPTLDAELSERGWTTVDLLDGDSLDQLRARYDELPHQITADQSFARGFHASIIDGRPGYRRAAHDLILDSVGPVLDELFVDMDIVLTNWVRKEPGGAAAPHHVDWSFVDEDLHRSVSVWMPLVDTDEETGCLGVIDRSHLRTGYVRSVDHPPFDAMDRALRELPDSVLLPLPAGRAVVYDHRLAHFSMPHSGATTRLALTCELVPKEADPLHFEYLGENRFVRHIVSSEFFLNYVAGAEPGAVAGHRGASEVSAASFDPSLVGGDVSIIEESADRSRSHASPGPSSPAASSRSLRRYLGDRVPGSRRLGAVFRRSRC